MIGERERLLRNARPRANPLSIPYRMGTFIDTERIGSVCIRDGVAALVGDCDSFRTE